MSDINAVIPILLVAFFLWLLGLTVVFYRLLYHYKRIAGRSSGGDILKLIETVLNKEDNILSQIKSLNSEIARLDKHLVKPIQKVGVVRFNPFKESGGDHSFSLSMLNLDEDGFILTGLHTRDRTRFYLKPVSAGESKVELSAEEEKSLKIARKS